MKHMSSQRTRTFWTYLHDQAEFHEQEFFQAIYDHAYQDEMRAAAETYDWLAKEFSLCLATPVSAAGGMEGSLTAEETNQFLHHLDQKIQTFVLGQEKLEQKKQEALAKAHGWDYYQVKRIYQEIENVAECELTAYRNSRAQLLSMLEGE
jgi:hypothetical protein